MSVELKSTTSIDHADGLVRLTYSGRAARRLIIGWPPHWARELARQLNEAADRIERPARGKEPA